LESGQHIDQPFDRQSSLTSSIVLLDRIAIADDQFRSRPHTHGPYTRESRTDRQTERKDGVVRTV